MTTAHRRRLARGAARVAAGLGVTILLASCAAWRPDSTLIAYTARGEHARGTQHALASLPASPRDTDYALHLMRFGMATLADGQTDAAEAPWLALYEILRTQGVNDELAGGVFFRDEEDLVYWKGEPYEQAMAYCYFAAQLASVADWYNAGVAADNALALLQAFERAEGEPFPGSPTPNAPDGTEAATGPGAAPDERERDAGYIPERVDFALAYALRGVAALAAGGAPADLRAARDAFRRAAEYRPQLAPVTEALLEGRANTVLWVDAGLGPRKVADRSGVDARFTGPRTRPGQLRVAVRTPRDAGGDRSGVATKVPAAAGATDLADLARRYTWEQLGELRRAKAAIGETLLAAGAATAAASDRPEIAGVGALFALVGMLQSRGARADLRHVEIMPAQCFLVAISITEPDTAVEVSIAGDPATRLVLPSLDPPPPGERLVFRYARLNAASEAPEWAHSGIVRYANPHHEQPVAGDHLPYIMGGTCTRPPTPGTLARYRAEGSLTDVSLEKLQNLYRAEGITWRLGDQRGLPTTHILEGGTSLIAPADGTAGYARLFCQLHPPYEPKSEQLKRFMRQREPFAAGGAQAPPDGWPTPDAARPAPRKDTP